MLLEGIKEILGSIKELLEKGLPYSFVGAIGGVAMQLNQMRKGEKFRLGMFIANIGLALWIGYIAGSLIPDSIGEIKYSIISICGFLSYPMLDFIEKKGLSLLLKKLLGVNEK